MILALDFDGVIWDSVDECYEVARRALAALGEELPGDFRQQFRDARWLVRTGDEFYPVLQLIQEQPATDFAAFDKNEFERRKAELQERSEAFHREFYTQRARLRDQDFERWMQLQQPYPQVLEALPRLRQAFQDTVIVTTKDEGSVHRLLGSVGIELPVLGKEFSTDKAEQVRHLARERDVSTDQVVMVDDLVDNLLQVEPTGARLTLADWGYNTAQEQARARRRGIAVVSPEGLEALGG